MNEIRIGLIGAGWMGRAHTQAFKNMTSYFGEAAGRPVFAVVSDADEAAAEFACRQLGYARSEREWIDVVRHPDVDLVDIATPNAFHYEAVRAALEHGKHVYCEKPLTISEAQSGELAALAREKGVVNYVGYNNVMNPANAYIKTLIDSGKLGQVIRFAGTYDQDGLLDPQLPITWRHMNRYAGCGALGDLGSHLLSVSQYLLGDIAGVNALSRTVIAERPISAGADQRAAVENDDIISALIRYANGAVGTMAASRVAAGRKNYLAYEIQGTLGTVSYDLERMNEVRVYFAADDEADRGFRQVLLSPRHRGYGAFQPAPGIAIGYNDLKILEARELFSAIVQGSAYTCDFAFAWKIDRTTEAILQSARDRTWVPIGEGER